jgi:peptide/nickel transport system substrate-binding protein
VAVCAAASVALAGCSGAAGSSSSGSSDTLDIATLTLPQSLDPAVANGSAMPFFQAVYDTLIQRAPDGTYRPMLATAWTYNTDRTELDLTLRTGVKFEDGTAFDASAVKANMDRFKKGGGGSAGQLASVASVTAVDAAHVRLKLSEPDPALLFSLSDAAGLMASPARFGQADSLKTTPDGTGPYRLDKGRTVIGTKWVFTRTAGYWGTALPYKTVTISYFDNETAIVNGIRTGQLDAAVLQDANQQASIESDPKVKTSKVEFDFQGLLLFDRGGVHTPALRDPRVRQALNHAVDRRTMLQQIRQGRGQVTDQVFGPADQGYDRGLDDYYSYDPAKARQLLAQAGYGGGFTLKLPRMSAIVNDALASSLRTDFKAIGVNLVWEQADASVLTKIFKDRAYSGMVMNMGQSATDWTVISTLVLPGTFNMFGTTDATVKSLVGRIQQETGAQAAADEKALNRHLVEQGWFVPFYRMTYLNVSVAGVKVTPQSGMAVPSIYDYAPAE